MPTGRNIEGLSNNATEVMFQLFIFGPTWDGDIISKTGRDDCIVARYAARENGWTFLTSLGVQKAVNFGMGPARDWVDKRWYNKAACK